MGMKPRPNEARVASTVNYFGEQPAVHHLVQDPDGLSPVDRTFAVVEQEDGVYVHEDDLPGPDEEWPL